MPETTYLWSSPTECLMKIAQVANEGISREDKSKAELQRIATRLRTLVRDLDTLIYKYEGPAARNDWP